MVLQIVKVINMLHREAGNQESGARMGNEVIEKESYAGVTWERVVGYGYKHVEYFISSRLEC